MKKITLLCAMLCTVCFMTGPAFAINHVENISCKGPSKIFFSKKTFERKYASAKHAPQPCLATYGTFPTSSDGHADDWAPYSKFQSQLITEPQSTVLNTLQTVVPQGAVVVTTDLQNPNDIVRAYRVKEVHNDFEILHFIVFRALKQSDGTVRVYRFEISMQADTHYLDSDHRGNSAWKPYSPSIPQRAYDHFNTVVNKNRAAWLQDIKALDTQE